MAEPKTLRQIQEARFAIERKALQAAAKDPTIVGVIRREYEEARARAVQSGAAPYLTGRADSLEHILAKLTAANETKP